MLRITENNFVKKSQKGIEKSKAGAVGFEMYVLND